MEASQTRETELQSTTLESFSTAKFSILQLLAKNHLFLLWESDKSLEVGMKELLK